MIIDTHSHTNKDYYDDIDSILDECKNLGIVKLIVPGTTLIDSKNNKKFKHPMLSYAIGVHPTETQKTLNRKDLEDIYSNDVIAIGECGLDYYYKPNEKDIQNKNFRTQIEFAKEKNLPLIVHTREALKDTLDILKDYYKKGDSISGVIHSADGDIKILEEIEDLGFYLSFNGISTFKNANHIREIIKETNPEKILIETDSPFLTPEPKRKEKLNKSTNIIYVLENIKNIKNNPNIEDILYKNSLDLFRL